MQSPLWSVGGCGALFLVTILSAFSAYQNYTTLIPTIPRRYSEYRASRVVGVPALTETIAYEGNDYPSELPLQLDRIVVEFDYGAHYALAAADEWASMFPTNKGRIHLGFEGRMFDIAMYQQLQCLNSLRAAYVAVHDENYPLSHPPANFTEAERCIDKLRQAILCTSDPTVDTAHVVARPGGGYTSASTGNGIDHRCKNYVKVREVVESMHM